MSRLIVVFVILQIVASLGGVIEHLEKDVALSTVANGGAEFSKSFYEASIKTVPGNFISSPVSVASVLSMLAYGARGPTQTALKAGLHFDKNDQIQRQGLKALFEELEDSPGVELRLANKIFLANSVSVKSDYQQLTEEIFKSSFEKVDFSRAEQASEAINSWCEQQTNFKIKDLVSPDILTPDTLAVLVNAVYFKGKWDTPFRKESTHDDVFHLEDGTIKNISTMHAWRMYKYGVMDDINAKFAELPYQGDQVSMFIVLPDEVTGLRNIQQNFAQLNLNRLLHDGRKIHLRLSLPKFEIETKIDLKQPLKDSGMGDIFENSADFSGMFNAPVKIDRAVQKAYIKVDEEGTEATAATFGVPVPASFPLTYDFQVDRPFYYAIVKRVGGPQGGGIVLFQGHYTNPTS